MTERPCESIGPCEYVEACRGCTLGGIRGPAYTVLTCGNCGTRQIIKVHTYVVLESED